MKTFACSWLLTSLCIVNMHSLPSIQTCRIFFVLMLLLSIRFKRIRYGVLGGVLASMTLFTTFLHLASHQLEPSQIGTDLDVVVMIDSVPEASQSRLGFIATVLDCTSCKRPLLPKKVRLSWYGKYPVVGAGERWQLTVRLKPPSSLRNDGGFDAVEWSLVKGLHARGYVRQSPVAKKLSEAQTLSTAIVRQTAAKHFERLTTHPEYLGLLQALTVGLKTHIGDDQLSVLRATGTAHLVAISGLHVGLVAAWGLIAGRLLSSTAVWLLQRCCGVTLTYDLRPVALFVSLLAAIFYAALAGFELPTQRAVLMLGVWLIAALRYRFLPPMSALSLALIVVLLVNPLNVMSAGFWLSFGTVAVLFYLHRGHVALHERSSKGVLAVLNKVKSMARTHLLLGLVLVPVGAWFFQSGSLIAPVANLLAVPWVAMVSVPLGLLALMASFISDRIARPLIQIAENSLRLLMQWLDILDNADLASVVLTLPGFMAFVMALLGLLIFIAPRGLRMRVIALPLFLPAILYNANHSASEFFEVHVLDVGQGLAVLVYTGEQTLLFDTGGKVSPRLSMFEAVVMPFLQASGRRRIDTLVVSHGDEDHAFGVVDFLRRFPDAQVISSDLSSIPDAKQAINCIAGQHWQSAGVSFAFMHPALFDSGSENDRSCVLMVYAGESRVLLTGDIEASAERQLLARIGNDVDFTVTMMTAPHHGSQTSSSAEFVERLRPDYVVFPAGYRNRYGFPHSDVQLRYKLAGSIPFVTGRHGAVSFTFDHEGLSRPPSLWWNSRRRFWHGIVNPDCWQQFAGQSLVRRLLALSQKGQTLCGK